MKRVLSLDHTTSALETLISAASKRKADLSTDLQMESIPLKELSLLAEEIILKHDKRCKKPALTCGSF